MGGIKMPFETQTINLQSKKIQGTSEFAVNTNISLDLEKPLKKILSVKAFADVSTFECVDTDLSLSGKAQVTVLYLTENDQYERVVGYADFQNSFKIAGQTTQVTVAVKDISINQSSATEISVSALLNGMARGVGSQEINPITSLSDEYVSKTKSVKINQICGCYSDKFVVNETFEMPNAKNILSIDACQKIKTVEASLDQATVSGEVDVKILYQTEESINTFTKTLEFRQEISCFGVKAGNQLYVEIQTASVNATLEFGEKTSVVVAVASRINVDAYSEIEFQTITDLFSLEKEISSTIDCVAYNNFVEGSTVSDTVMLTVDNVAENIDEVVGAVNPVVEVSHLSSGNSTLQVEAVVKFDLIFKNNQTDSIETKQIVCPFVSSWQTENMFNVEEYFAVAKVTNIKPLAGKNLDVVFELTVVCSSCKENYFEFAQNVQEISAKENSKSAITIYVTKEGEDIFDVARALCVKPEVIESQNEVVDGKFSGGTRVFVYSPINVEF